MAPLVGAAVRLRGGVLARLPLTPAAPLQNLMMAKIIAVREAMLAAFSQTSGRDAGGSWPAEEQTQQLRAAGNHLARAIDDLPTPQELDAAQVAAADFALPSEVHEDVFPAQAPTSLLPAHSLSGAAASLDGSALRALPTVPPASDAMVASTIQAMTSPGQLYAYWQDWTAELKEQWEAAEDARFGAASQAGLARVMDKMTQIWWHAAHLKPAYLADLSFAALPRDGAQQELWAAIAVCTALLLCSRAALLPPDAPPTAPGPCSHFLPGINFLVLRPGSTPRCAMPTWR